MTVWLEWIAFSIGTLGTLFWALKVTWKGKAIEGWFWLVSAIIWIIFAIQKGHTGLMARDLLGVFMYIIGIINSFRKPKNIPQPIEK